MTMRACTKCGVLFDTRNCNACARARAKAWREKNLERSKDSIKAWGLRNPEKRLAAAKKWVDANPEKRKAVSARYSAKNKEKLNALSTKWSKENPKKLAASLEKYRQAHRADICSRARAKYAANPEPGRIASRNRTKVNPEYNKLAAHTRRARARSVPGTLTKGLYARLFEFQNGKCACCGVSLSKGVLDHVYPISRGGHNADKNMQLLTQTCNQQKYNSDPEEFMRSRRPEYVETWSANRQKWSNAHGLQP